MSKEYGAMILDDEVNESLGIGFEISNNFWFLHLQYFLKICFYNILV